MSDAFDLNAFLSEISTRLVTSDSIASQSERLSVKRDRALVFELADVHYAVKLTHVMEVQRHPTITPVPGTPSWVAGVINLRGDIASVVDMARFLDRPSTYIHQSRQPSTVLILTAEDQRIGMVVDSVSTIYSYPAEAVLSPVFEIDPVMVPYLRGVLEWNDKTVRFLDCTALLTGAQMQQFV